MLLQSYWSPTPVSWPMRDGARFLMRAFFMCLSFPPLISNLLYIALVCFTLPSNISKIQTFQIFFYILYRSIQLCLHHIWFVKQYLLTERSHTCSRRGDRGIIEKVQWRISPPRPPPYPPSISHSRLYHIQGNFKFQNFRLYSGK